MTLEEAKNRVYMLLDEHSAGGEIEHDEDIELKMVHFLDMAQKELAKIKKVVKTRNIVRKVGQTTYSLPEDCLKVARVFRDGYPANYRYIGRKLYIPESDRALEIILEYFAIPETIDENTPDSYEFEIAEDACNAMPYYVCAQQLLPDLVTDYGAFIMMYRDAVANLVPTETPGAVRNSFYRGRV